MCVCVCLKLWITLLITLNIMRNAPCKILVHYILLLHAIGKEFKSNMKCKCYSIVDANCDLSDAKVYISFFTSSGRRCSEWDVCVCVLQFNFVGRILGPRGLTAKQLEAETGCKIMVRGKGSMRDKKKVRATNTHTHAQTFTNTYLHTYSKHTFIKTFFVSIQ